MTHPNTDGTARQMAGEELLEILDRIVAAQWPQNWRFCADAAREIRTLRATLAERMEDLWDALHQGAIVSDNVIDNRCLSTYEGLCSLFEKHGWLQRINSRMYRIVRVAAAGAGEGGKT